MSQKSPFKFLQPYTREDRKIFFGRDEEIEQLYKMVFQADIILVYGESGTGKTSLVQCGLASRFQPTDWLDLFVRRKNNINDSLREVLIHKARNPVKPEASLTQLVKSVYLDYFRPVFLIFDQFEELFIFGREPEQQQFIQDISELQDAGLSCKIIIVMREEYLAHLYNFEKVIPEIYNKRLRVEPMGVQNAHQVIEQSCKELDVEIMDAPQTIGKIIENVSGGKAGVQLSYLQVYLDRLWHEAVGAKPPQSPLLTQSPSPINE